MATERRVGWIWPSGHQAPIVTPAVMKMLEDAKRHAAVQAADSITPVKNREGLIVMWQVQVGKHHFRVHGTVDLGYEGEAHILDRFPTRDAVRQKVARDSLMNGMHPRPK